MKTTRGLSTLKKMGLVLGLTLLGLLPSSLDASTITGTVRRASDSTVVPNALVLLRRTSATSAILDSARTDSLGGFTFDSLASGTPNYYVTASDSGFSAVTFSNISLSTDVTLSINIYL